MERARLLANRTPFCCLESAAFLSYPFSLQATSNFQHLFPFAATLKPQTIRASSLHSHLVGGSMRHQLHAHLAALFLVTCSAMPLVASAADACEDRYTTINDKYSAAYTALDSECAPVESRLQENGSFELSPECLDRYNTLASQANTEYAALFEECADVLFPPTVVDPIPCEQEFNALNERFSAAYITLDAQCYPSDGAAWCGFEISQECQCYPGDGTSRSDVSSTPWMSENTAERSIRSLAPKVVAAPTKVEMLSKIKSLKKQLRRAKAKNKKMRASCGR